MLDVPTHPLTPTRPRLPSLTQSAPSTQAPTDDPSFSLLLSLPRELRDRIYAFTLTSPHPFWWQGQPSAKYNVGVNLLRTNKQIYGEAAPLLYTANKFLFTHPSDCNIFRVVASPHAENINSVYFRIREKDLRLWTTYLGSKSVDRSLKADLPKLKNLWISLRCASGSTPRLLGHLGVHGFGGGPQGFGGVGVLPHPMVAHVQAVQNALGQQVAALQQQVQHVAHTAGVTGPPVVVPTGAHVGQHFPPSANPLQNATAQHPAPPPPPPPLPAMPFITFATGAVPHHHPQPPTPAAQGHPNHNVLNTFLRFERELGIESLCLSLRETLQDHDYRVEVRQPANVVGADARGGHRERRREDREIAARGELGHREERKQERDWDRRTERDRDEHGVSKKRREVPDVKIVCVVRVPKPEVSRLVRMYPEELSVDRNGDARTRYRKLHGVDICVEINGLEGTQG